MGAILAPGSCTVAAVVCVMGKSHDSYFQNYHRVLNRARWSPIKANRVLLGLLLNAIVQEGPGVIGIDETVARYR